MVIVIGCVGAGAILACRELATSMVARAMIGAAAGLWAGAVLIFYKRLALRK
jgi:hypothetical protein